MVHLGYKLCISAPLDALNLILSIGRSRDASSNEPGYAKYHVTRRTLRDPQRTSLVIPV